MHVFNETTDTKHTIQHLVAVDFANVFDFGLLIEHSYQE